MGLIESLLGSIGGGVLNSVQPRVAAGQDVYSTHYSIEHGDTAYNTAAKVYGAIGGVGVETIIWERTVPAQQQSRWGFGSPATPQNQGYMWFAILDSTTDWSVGTLRLAQQNHSRTKTVVVKEMSDSQLHSTTVTSLATAALLNKNEMIALPEKVEFPKVGEDSYMQLRYILTTAATAADAAGFRIPVTIYQ